MKILLATAQPADLYALSQMVQQCDPSITHIHCLISPDEHTAAEFQAADLVFIDAQWMDTHADMLLCSGEALLSQAVLILRDNIAIPSWLSVLHRCIRPPFTEAEIMPIIWHKKAEIQRKEELIYHRIQQEIALSFKEERSFANQRLVFSNQEEMVFIPPLDLIRIEAKGNCSMIYALGYPGAFCVATNLGEFNQRLEGVPFLFQPHRSHLVNLYHIKKLTRQRGGALLVRAHNGNTDVAIPLSQQRREELLEKMNRLGRGAPLLNCA